MSDCFRILKIFFETTIKCIHTNTVWIPWINAKHFPLSHIQTGTHTHTHTRRHMHSTWHFHFRFGFRFLSDKESSFPLCLPACVPLFLSFLHFFLLVCSRSKWKLHLMVYCFLALECHEYFTCAICIHVSICVYNQCTYCVYCEREVIITEKIV